MLTRFPALGIGVVASNGLLPTACCCRHHKVVTFAHALADAQRLNHTSTEAGCSLSV